MDPIAPDPTKPLGVAPRRFFLGRIAEGVSQPPWSWRAAALAVLVSFAGFMRLPELFYAVSKHWLPDVRVFWPSLVFALPMLCCLGYLSRQAGTTVGKAFGLSGARVSQVLISSLLLFILEMLVTVGTVALLMRLGFEKVPGVREQARAAASSFFLFTDATVWGPLCEELWFRALLYTSLRTRFRVAPSTVVTAALFASIHHPGNLLSAAGLFFPAALSSLWYERTRSLWPSVIAHSLMNTLPILVVATT